MDRNFEAMLNLGQVWVALLTEGVDRNIAMPQTKGRNGVALLTEGVDRNIFQWCSVL